MVIFVFEYNSITRTILVFAESSNQGEYLFKNVFKESVLALFVYFFKSSITFTFQIEFFIHYKT